MEAEFMKEIYNDVPTGSPVLIGHVFNKFKNKYGDMRHILKWVNLTNESCNYKAMKMGQLRKYKLLYRHRYVKRGTDLNKEVSRSKTTPPYRICKNKAASLTSSSEHKLKNSSSQTIPPILHTSRTQTMLRFPSDDMFKKRYQNLLSKYKKLNEKYREELKERDKLQNNINKKDLEKTF